MLQKIEESEYLDDIFCSIKYEIDKVTKKMLLINVDSYKHTEKIISLNDRLSKFLDKGKLT